MIFTDRRYLTIYNLNKGFVGNSYYKSGSNWDKLLGRKTEDRRWVDPHQDYKESYLIKLNLAKKLEIMYSTIKGFIEHNYSIQCVMEEVLLVELQLDFYDRSGDIYKTFKAQDGEFISDLLTRAIQNDGKLSGDESR